MLSNNFKKYIKSLHKRKFRQKYNKIQVDGSKSCIEVAQQIPNAIDTIICTQSWLNSLKVTLPDCDIQITTPDEVKVISQLDHNVDVSMIIDMNFPINNTDYTDEWSIYLDDVQDPGNVGTIIRLADWYGISKIYCSPSSAKVDNPKVIQATMGGFTRVQSIIISQEAFIKDQAAPFVIADLDGTPIKQYDAGPTGCLVIGNEGRGISQIFTQSNHITVTIPGYGRAESLNASVSCGIILSHLL